MSRFTVSGWVCFRVRVMVSLGNIIKLATLEMDPHCYY